MAARFWAKTPLTGGKIDETKPYSEVCTRMHRDIINEHRLTIK